MLLWVSIVEWGFMAENYAVVAWSDTDEIMLKVNQNCNVAHGEKTRISWNTV